MSKKKTARELFVEFWNQEAEKEADAVAADALLSPADRRRHLGIPATEISLLARVMVRLLEGKADA